METQQVQPSEAQRTQWQQTFQGSPIHMASSHNPSGSISAPSTSRVNHSATLSPPLLTSQSGHRYADYTAPKISPAHVSATFALAGGSSGNISRHNSQSPHLQQQYSPNNNGNPASGYNSPQFFQQQQPSQQPQQFQDHTSQQTSQASPFSNSYSFQSSSSRPPISVMTSNPSTPSHNQMTQDTSSSSMLSMPMPIPGNMMAGQSSSSTFAFLGAGILDPTSMIYDENSGGYATPSYAGSYADDSSFDDRRSHSPFDSRPESRSPNNNMLHQQNRRTSVALQEPAFANNATDLLAFRETVQQGRGDWDDLSSLGAQDHISNISNTRSSPSNHLSSPDLGANKQLNANFEGSGLEMAIERMFAPITSPRMLPARDDTFRATSAPPPALQAPSAPLSARSVFTASPAHSPDLGAQQDFSNKNGSSNDNIAVPQLQRFSPSPTSQGNFLQQQQQQQQEGQGQPSLRSPPLPHLANQSSSSGENKNSLLAPLAIPDKPDLTLTTATPTAFPRTATARQDSTQAALDTVFSTFFQRPANRQDSKDSTDSGPTNQLHAEAAQALFGNVPPHDLTLDLGGPRNRAPPTRQRSKSDTYINSPTTFYGPSFAFGGGSGSNTNSPRNPEQQPQRQQTGPAIDPRELDGSPGWEAFKASAMASLKPQQQQGDSALIVDEDEDAMSANVPSAVGPAARRRSHLDSSPYGSYGQGGMGEDGKQSYLVPPSQGGPSLKRSTSHGSAHTRNAQSENYTSSTFSPRNGEFGGLVTPNPLQMPQELNNSDQQYSSYQQQDGNRFLGGGYEPQGYSSHSQYDMANLPPMPSAFLGGQESQYGLPTSTSVGDYSRQPSVDYGQQPPTGYPSYLPQEPGQYNPHGGSNLMPHHFPQYMPPGLNAYNPPDGQYNQHGMLYPPSDNFIGRPGGMPEGARMRRRSSVRSDTSAVSGLSNASEFTWESKTTEATKQAAKRRRKDPAAAKFVCEYCNETFTRAYNLKGHIRSHEGLKPFTCQVCNKGFARRHDLKRHELLHSGVKKYICEACQQPFVRLDALQRHHKSENGAACVQQIAQMAAAAGVDFTDDGPSPQPEGENYMSTYPGTSMQA